MKTRNLLAVFFLMAGTAFAQSVGPYVTLGGGFARMSVGSFSVYNPVAVAADGEELSANDRISQVGFARLSAGYNFTEHLAVQVGYTKFGKGRVSLGMPQYPDLVWTAQVGAGPNVYSKHDMVFETTTISLTPIYTHALSENSRLIVGMGVNRSTTDAHLEATYKKPLTATEPTPVYQSYTYAGESSTEMGYTFMLGYDRLVWKTLSVGFVTNISTSKMRVPADPWTKRSADKVNLVTGGFELYCGWHW